MPFDVAHLSYGHRLKRLGLSRLDRRRDRSDLIEAHRIISGVYNVQSEILLSLIEVDEEVIAKII